MRDTNKCRVTLTGVEWGYHGTYQGIIGSLALSSGRREQYRFSYRKSPGNHSMSKITRYFWPLLMKVRYLHTHLDFSSWIDPELPDEANIWYMWLHYTQLLTKLRFLEIPNTPTGKVTWSCEICQRYCGLRVNAEVGFPSWHRFWERSRSSTTLKLRFFKKCFMQCWELEVNKDLV